MGKMLKMIADWRFNEKPEGTRDWEDIVPDERDNNSWWYLDGVLESIVHYDKATVTNCKSGGFGVETINWRSISGDKVTEIETEKPMIYRMCFDGIVDVEIEGIDKPCIGYFWTTNHQVIYWEGKPYEHWDQRGLVCLQTDFEACERAERKMKQKKNIL